MAAQAGGAIAGGWLGNTIPAQPPGHHQLRVQVVMKIGAGSVWDPETPVLNTRELQLMSEFDVLNEAQPISLIKTPDATVMAKGTRAYGFCLQANSNTWLEGEVALHQLPENAAFDVFARTKDGQEYALGQIHLAKGEGCDFGVFAANGKKPTTMPASIDVILRSSAAAAEESIDLTDIWDGQVIIPNVPVQTPATQPSGH